MRHLRDVTGHTPGVEHHVALPPPPYNGPAVDAMRAAGARIHHVPMARLPPHPVNLAAVVALRSLIRRLAPAVVHGHASIGGALARLAAAGTRVPAVYSPHSLGPAQDRLAAGTERLLGRLTTRLVAVSESEARLAATMGLVPPERIVVVPNGVDLTPPPAALRAALGVEEGVPLVGMVARLEPPKDPVTFVQACARVARRHPAAEFVLVGDGPLKASVDAAVSAAGLGRRWHHLTGVADAGGLYGGMDVFVFSTWFEGGPYAPLEAMRAGVPVVLTDVVGNRDVVEPGVSGLLVPPGDVEATAEAVGALLDDPAGRQAMGCAGRVRVVERFGVEVMGRSLQALYCELAAGR